VLVLRRDPVVHEHFRVPSSALAERPRPAGERRRQALVPGAVVVGSIVALCVLLPRTAGLDETRAGCATAT
jgi:hypothetical protein